MASQASQTDDHHTSEVKGKFYKLRSLPHAHHAGKEFVAHSSLLSLEGESVERRKARFASAL